MALNFMPGGGVPVWLKDTWNKLRKGAKAGMAAVKESDTLTDNRVVMLINEFKNSDKLRWMLCGEKYYQVDNEILSRKIIKMVNGHPVEETYKANNKLAHAKYKNMVDEKIAYLLSKPVTFKIDDNDKEKPYSKLIKNELGKHFQYQLSELGYEASNKGTGWLQVYVDEAGAFKTMVVPSEQCIPVWTDRSHTELETMIRVYPTQMWEYDAKKVITNVEVWTAEDVTHYRLDGKLLVLDYERSNDNSGPIAHYKINDQWYAWGKVPFIPFKNNQVELPDIKFVKSLVDAYDLSRSEAANYVEEVKNLIFVLKGYGGEDLAQFVKQMNEDRAIPVDADDESGVDTLTPQMDITALREHYEQLKRDMIEDGQSVNKDLDKFGSAPSGVALKFMYAGLDLKCNLMESEFKMSFETLLYFVDEYLSFTGQGDYSKIEVEIVFNRDAAINETEIIENCNKSKGTISDDTIIAHHPFVSDIEAEKEAMVAQRKEERPTLDRIPIKKGGVAGEEE